MSQQYDNYISNHQNNVKKAFNLLLNTLGENYLINDLHIDMNRMVKLIHNHDKSKFDEEEYDAYDKYFYRDPTDKFNVLVLSGQIDRQANFDKAWLHHQHHNPHHWQHWILRNDDGDTKVLDMDIEYIIEMICDWLSFSISKGNSKETIDFYTMNKTKMIFSSKTRNTVEYIINQLENNL